MASDLTTTFPIQIAELGNLRGCVDGETRDGEGACELQRVKLTHVFRTDLLCATQVCMHLNLLSMVRISCGYVSRALFFVYIYVWAGCQDVCLVIRLFSSGITSQLVHWYMYGVIR